MEEKTRLARTSLKNHAVRGGGLNKFFKLENDFSGIEKKIK